MQCELYDIVAIPHLLIIFAFSVVTREKSKVYLPQVLKEEDDRYVWILSDCNCGLGLDFTMQSSDMNDSR